MITEYEKSMIQAFFDYNRIPMWLLDNRLKLTASFFPEVSETIKKELTTYMEILVDKISNPDFDILCYENDLYYIFAFQKDYETFHLLAGPMLLSGFYHKAEMHTLSFASCFRTKDLEILVETLPVVSLSSFSSCLRIMMLFFKKEAPLLDEILNFKFSSLQGSLKRTFIYEFFENMEEGSIHTPYIEELEVLNCVRDGNVNRLETTYKTLPRIKYGHMSNNPLRQLFYGCIANTTLVTRYAIEGGLEEESAFTLSDVYIKQMENCRTLYELNTVNEKMAVDFTYRVAESKNTKQPEYIKPITQCMDYICRNIHTRVSLELLSKEVSLTPKYLSWLFRKETGQTLSSFIESQKINQAKNLLIYSRYSCNDISQYLSYYSQSYFISIFKKNVGMTPNQYRNKCSRSEWHPS